MISKNSIIVTIYYSHKVSGLVYSRTSPSVCRLKDIVHDPAIAALMFIPQSTKQGCMPGHPPCLMFTCVRHKRRSQWPRSLRHELSSLARTLGSWVRIPLKAWMYVCVYSMFVSFCV
jgi:hypothetical protein